MPIPTRSKSVRSTSNAAHSDGMNTANAKSRTATYQSVSESTRDRATSAAERVTRLARPVSSHLITSSVSSTVRPRPLGNENDGTSATAAHQPASRVLLNRSVQHARTQSNSMAKSVLEHSSHISRGTSNTHNRTISQTSGVPSRIKPPFDNHKQHFSPQKPAANGLQATQVGAPPTNIGADVATPQLREELFIAACVHQGSLRTLLEFENSVKGVSDAMGQKLRQDIEHVNLCANERQMLVNADALYRWSIDNSGAASPEKLRNLGTVLFELSRISGNVGSFTQYIEDFEVMLEGTQASIEVYQLQGSVRPTRPISNSLSRSVDDLQHRLNNCERILSDLRETEAREDSTLADVLLWHCELVNALKTTLRESVSLMRTVQSRHRANQTEKIDRIVETACERAVEPSLARQPIWEQK